MDAETGVMFHKPSEVLVWKERDVWLAAWRRYEVMAQGPTREEAVERLFRCIAAQCVMDAEEGRLPFSDVEAPPLETVKLWEHLAERTNKEHEEQPS